jgi:two-component system NtrC family sensor kinase
MAFAEGDRRHLDECDLTELILSIADYMEPELADQNIKLELALEAAHVMRVPRAQLVTVIENILHNAVDAMPDGGTVTVATTIQDGVVMLSITDTGCGMDPGDVQAVFEPFYSTKTGDALNFEHHPGLGLTVALGILQVLGHTISIDSDPGKSTTVSVRFNPDADRRE